MLNKGKYVGTRSASSVRRKGGRLRNKKAEVFVSYGEESYSTDRPEEGDIFNPTSPGSALIERRPERGEEKASEKSLESFPYKEGKERLVTD